MDYLDKNWKYVVIGNPIKHSRSPEMQNSAFNYHGLGNLYGKILVEHQELAEFVKLLRSQLNGCNITVPHKEGIIPFLDEIDPVALQGNSVNTVINCDGKLTGYSTDGYGLEQSIRVNFDTEICGNSFIFVGVGGAAQAVAWHFASLGAKRIYLVNRTLEKAESLAKKISLIYPKVEIYTFQPNEDSKLSEAIKLSKVIIQATSLGLKSDDINPFNFQLLLENRDICISDMIYHQTKLLEFAQNNGFKFSSGKEMLVYQGAKSFEIWTNKSAPVDLMLKALN